MFCTKCGAENTNNSDFCVKCGTRIQNQKSVMSIPYEITLKSTLASVIDIKGTSISYKMGLKSDNISVSDITEISYKAGNRTYSC